MTATRLFAACAVLCATLGAQTKQHKRDSESAYGKWLDVDVAYIITDAERKAFTRLGTDDEREQFVEQFWRQRDPTPDTDENEFKEEHYRRIAYANEHFASGIPGWKTDRGRIYIIHGPPDEIESHAAGGSYQRPQEEGGGSIATYPFEIWRYRYIEGIGNNVLIEFVDPTMTGEFHMTIDPDEKNALAHVPNGTPTPGPLAQFQNSREFDRIQQWADVNRPPFARFPDLEPLVNSNIRYNVLPMKVQAESSRATETTATVPVTIQFENHDLQFKEQAGGPAEATVNVYVRISTLSRRVVNVHEGVIKATRNDAPAIYGVTFYLAPGSYRLNIVAKDVVGGNIAIHESALRVP